MIPAPISWKWWNEVVAITLLAWALKLLYPHGVSLFSAAWNRIEKSRGRLGNGLVLIAIGASMSFTAMSILDAGPQLSGKIQKVQITTKEGEVYALLQVVIDNKGTPSTVRGYELDATLLSGDTVRAHREAITNEGITLQTPRASRPAVLIPRNEALWEKTVERPIPVGGSSVGYLWFHFDNMTTNDLSVTGVICGKIRVSKFGMNGTTFYLQDVSRGAGLSREHTLDRVTVYLCNTRFTGNLSSRDSQHS